LAKDVEAVDDRLAFQWFQFLTQILSVGGTVVLVFYTYAYLGILLLFFGLASFFGHTSRDLKRIDSTTRSFIYSHFAEQLVGTLSIRAFGQQEAFLKKISDAIDYEFRFHYTSMVVQRWLALRLDSLGSLLVLGVGLFGVFFCEKVLPSKFGVVITYTMQSTQLFAVLLLTWAVLEQGA
jgi:ATP-binding cassette subfamily C (CFTR/MRP) protein 1